MLIPKIILSISIFVWLLVPIRHYGARFFYYFLILAILDPLILFIHLFVELQPVRIYSIGVLFQILFLFRSDNVLKHKILAFVSTISIIVFSFYFDVSAVIIMIMLENIFILLFLIRMTVLNIYDSQQINLFYLFLDFYVFTLIIKFLVDIINLHLGLFYFYATTAFEIIIAILFIIYNEKNSPRIWLASKN